MKRVALAALAVFALTASAFAQLPPGKWWKRPEVIQRLELTDEQQSRLDGIWRAAANDLIDVKADMDKLQIALRTELDQQQLNRGAIRQIAVRLNEARSRRFERELMMFVDMRSVLSDAQWNRMRAELDRLATEGARPNAQQGGGRRNLLRPH